MKSKHYIFSCNQGEKVIDGKPYYPHFVNIYFKDKRQALEQAEIIIRQIRENPNDDFDIGLLLWGELAEDNE